MRHQKSGRILGRKSAHRRAMYRNMVTSILEHGRIRTTEAKAKELRKFVERTITTSLRAQDVATKPEQDRTPAEKAQFVHAMRKAGRLVHDRDVLRKLFVEIAPKLKGRPGGYTRILRVGPRVGDAAPMVLIELVCHEGPGATATA